jgi:hypothetical protein
MVASVSKKVISAVLAFMKNLHIVHNTFKMRQASGHELIECILPFLIRTVKVFCMTPWFEENEHQAAIVLSDFITVMPQNCRSNWNRDKMIIWCTEWRDLSSN